MISPLKNRFPVVPNLSTNRSRPAQNKIVRFEKCNHKSGTISQRNSLPHPGPTTDYRSSTEAREFFYSRTILWLTLDIMVIGWLKDEGCLKWMLLPHPCCYKPLLRPLPGLSSWKHLGQLPSHGLLMRHQGRIVSGTHA